ncbi:hypothetical protein QMT40_001789 [Parvibaculaceae bacterium PLY_AMNH_Bact1]|nr:hypothetical protein QMT40_001789 [Parvibaculaceae bacterium PLY_AMNH_Bact1]
MTGKNDDPNPSSEPKQEAEEAPIEDVDEIALAEARAAVKAEEAAANEDADAVPEEGAEKSANEGEEPSEPEEPKDDDGEEPKPEMIPKARFDEVNNKKNESEKREAFLMGQIEALKAEAKANDQPDADKPPTPEERIAEIRSEKVALAEKFDAGEISAAELEKGKSNLDDQEWEIRSESLKPAEQPKPVVPEPSSDLYMEQRTAELEQQHPYLQVITSTADWDFLKEKAIEALVEENVLPETGVFATPGQQLAVRTRIAELSDRYGPILTDKTPEEVGLKSSQEKPAVPDISPEAAAKARADKLKAAEAMPPDVQGMNGGGADDGVMTAEKAAELSEDAYEALPRNTVNKILGIESS